MSYDAMREVVALKYHKDDIFIALSDGKTFHVVTSHLYIGVLIISFFLWGGGG